MLATIVKEGIDTYLEINNDLAEELAGLLSCAEKRAAAATNISEVPEEDNLVDLKKCNQATRRFCPLSKV